MANRLLVGGLMRPLVVAVVKPGPVVAIKYVAA